MKRVFVFAVLMAALTVQSIWADAPQTMSYQGVLNDNSGQPVADGNYSLAFAIYTTGGTQLWTETHGSVATSGGVFSVILGSQGTPLALAFDQAYELGISVNGGTELSPRMPLSSVPYSLNTRTISQENGSTVISNTLNLKSVAEGLTIVGEDPFPTTGRDTRFIRIVDVNDTDGQPDGDLVIEGYTTSDNGRTPLMTISGRDGRIGFGTYDPTESFGGDVRMRLKGAGHIMLQHNYGFFSTNSAGTGWGAGMDTHTNDGLIFYTAGISQPDFYIAPDSRVGVGTIDVTGQVGNAAMRVALDGHIVVNKDFGLFSVHSSGSGLGAGIDTHPDDGLRLVTGGANRVFLTPSGTMGIGIANPTGFHVVLPEGAAAHAAGVSLSGGAAGNANIEIRNNGSGTPYLDFSNDTGVDFDVRLILAGDNQLNVEGGTLVQTSDRRLKENIQPLKSSLENLSQLTGYSYNFKAGVFGNDTKPSPETLGLIAQEVEKVYPQLVSYNKEMDRYHLDYNGIIPVLVEGTKELKAQMDKQKVEIAELKAMLNGLMNRMAAMEKDSNAATVKRTRSME